ncbi:EAL domain, c-di-GMP-specific phosphodiesterase class I (or its enzymatically inactive variant) [Rathayibacter oskolensis]|uniref:EAL domain, c-di-GMP-specific phosphodiesterase class I (Or its enzymatically inactive variant) n=1 Tax=Rathayibacter oskolensis TaxID=1891671 RepID=A0A1X7NX40_9MICO|nr:EAL domain-containing protein [Rathayibacter oskolensis]SMH42925.1 EAL domain, c-di-GMP-specific phosphodiesterase class I (or its enzymatically inactive variant) [Rathayibacter oskolensis]
MVVGRIDVVATHFQPIVDLASGRVVAHEALSRFADDSGPVSPDSAFEDAYRRGAVESVDDRCIGRAVVAADELGGRDAHELFVNVEPPTLWRERLPAGLTSGLPLTIEITERALGKDTGRLLAAIERLRELGHAIAVDDLGAEPATLALLPLIAPDVIKLDMGLIRQQPDVHAARIMTAVADYSGRNETVVLAEGIENERHELTARALGATLGQGWHYGRPGPAEAATRVVTSPTERREWRARIARSAAASSSRAATPFEIVSAAVPARRADRALLLQVSTFLEERAHSGGDSAVLLATFQRDSNVSPATRSRYERLADSGCLLTVYTVGGAPGLPAGALNRVIAADDRLAAEWDVIVLTADHAAALTAREVDASRHAEGEYDFVLTTDRELVTHAARALLAHR